jgi:hypothetical protein
MTSYSRSESFSCVRVSTSREILARLLLSNGQQVRRKIPELLARSTQCLLGRFISDRSEAAHGERKCATGCAA